MNIRVCIVEDDPTIRQFVGEKLAKQGYGHDSFASAEEVLEEKLLWDLYILDIMLEGELSGLQLCEALRKQDPSTPILMLSALSEPADRIEGLRLGADDYLPKPFEMEELLLRVDAMLRRRHWYGKLPHDSPAYHWSENWVHFQRFEAGRGDKVFPLSQKECMLMKLLIEHSNEVVTRNDVLDKVWGYDVYPSSRTVDNFILRLRKYFEEMPSRPRYIHTVRGLGYKFTPEAQ